MQSFQTPPCSKCGDLAPEKISERRADLTGGFFVPPTGALKGLIYVFRCKCGETFTHRVKDGELLKQIVGTMNEDGRDELAAEAHRLQREIGRKVDNPNCQFRGDDFEACIAKLRAVAKQCDAEGLPVAAQRLNQLACDVVRRWEE
jgi:hypothetical protein